MTAVPQAAAPTVVPTSTGRLVGVDVARALAVLGMFAAHVNPGQLDPDDWLRQIVSGRSAVLFVMLAGVSVALATGTARGRPPRSGAHRALVVRALVLFVVGLGLAALGTTVTEILTLYAVLFVLAIPVTTASGRALAVLAGVSAVAGPVASFLLRSGPLPPRDDLLGAVQSLLLDGTFPVITWLPFLLAGLAISRLDLADPGLARRLLGFGTATGVVAHVSSWLATGPLGGFRGISAATGVPLDEVRATAASPVGVVPADHPAYLLISSPHSGAPLEIIGSTGIAMAVLGACLLLAPRAPRVLAPLQATGRIALSAYVGHILLIALIGLPGMVALLTDHGYGLLLLVVLATPLLALGTTTWLGRGPLERLVTATAGAAARTADRRERPRWPRPRRTTVGHRGGSTCP